MSYSSGRTPYKKPPPKKKYIYQEDDIYAAEGANGWYLFHTTKDPENKFHQVRIGDLTEMPSTQYRNKKIRYGQDNSKVKWLLKKEEIQEWIEDSYPDFIFEDKPSPWAPKKLGEKTDKPTREETDSEEEQPPKKRVRKSSSDTEEEEVSVKKSELVEIRLMLQEILSHLRNESPKSASAETEGQ